MNIIVSLFKVALIIAEYASASGENVALALTSHTVEETLANRKVSLIQFFDSTCLNCENLDSTALEHVRKSLLSVSGADNDFGIFRLDVSHSIEDANFALRFGVSKGKEALRVFQGKQYVRAYQGGFETKDIVEYLVAVRDGKTVRAPKELRSMPAREPTSYIQAFAAARAARQRTKQVKIAADATSSLSDQASSSSSSSATANPYVTGIQAQDSRNFTFEAQQLILQDDEMFIPKDPRHLALYEYAAWHHSQVARLKDPNDPATDIKFVVFQELSKVLGFGNQVEGLLSALMFAMMTHRVFVIDWGRDHNNVDPLELFQELPLNCKLETFLPHFRHIMDDNHLRVLERQIFNGRNPNDQCMVPSPDWVCRDLDVQYADPVVILKGNIYSGHILSYNSHYSQIYAFLFGERGLDNNPYSSLFRWLLRPLPYILEMVETFKKENFAAEGMRTVGIHMRVRDSFLKTQSVPFFWECAHGNFRLNDTTFYLATDNPIVQKEAQTQLHPAVVKWFKHVGNDKNSLRADAEHRLVDILLLGECDDLIVTCGSSYSRVAYSRADIVPLFVTYESHRWSLRHEPHQCLRATTAKPCAARYLNQIDKAPCLQNASPELLEEIYLECDVS